MGGLWRDVVVGLRRLRGDWMASAVAVVSLGAAVGGNGAVFSMIDAFLFRPLPYEAPERVVLLGERRLDQPPLQGNLGTSLPTWADIAERSRSVTAWAAFDSRMLTVRGEERSDAVQGAAVTRDFFDVLGVAPPLGRTFDAGEAVEGGPRVVLLSHEFLVDRYGAGADPLGDVLVVAGEPHEVVGVLPEGFQFLFPRLDLWVPLTDRPTEADRGDRDVIALGRLAPGVTTREAAIEVTGLAAALADEHPGVQGGWAMDTYNLRHDVPTRQTRILFGLLQGSVALVLLIACANIANLLLARGRERSGEIALRTVLGAERGRIVRQLLTETGVLVGAGGLFGIGVAWLGIRWISGEFAGVLPPGYDPRLDGRVLAATGILAVAAVLLAGLAPALQTFRRSQAGALRDGARAGTGRGRKTVSRVLVVAEISLSFVALGGGSLLVRSFLEIQGGGQGIDGGRILTAVLADPTARTSTPDQRADLRRRVLERLRATPGVEAAALSDAVPRGFTARTDSVRLPGEDGGAEPAPLVTVVGASGGYLQTVGVTLVRGRFVEARDGAGAPPVAVVSQALATAAWGTDDPVGRSVLVGGVEREVVGVVSDVEPIIRSGGADARLAYVPLDQSDGAGSVLLLRSSGPAEGLAEPARRALRDVDPDLALASVLTYEAFLERAFTGIRVFNVILGGFGVMALVLASVGIWGVLAHSVAQRRREIGVRMAVGAARRSVAWMFLVQGVRLGLVGLALGVVLTLPLVGLLSSLVQGVSTLRPWTLAGIAGLLFTVTVVACLVPAWRAAGVDPVGTLREE